MSTDAAGLTDQVIVGLNGVVQGQRPSVPGRPGDSASSERWLSYVVALGAGEDVGRETRHWDGEAGTYVVVPALTVPQMRDLASRLGG